MILQKNNVSSRPSRAWAAPKPVRIQRGRQSTVKVNAFFGMGAPSSGNNEAVLELVNSKFSGPSEAGNAAVADAVASFGRVNKNPRSKDLYGQWSIVYASGNTGLTALEGKIAKFTITSDGAYENECTTRIAGIFPGSAKEGGQLKVTGGNKFDLLQEYREFTRPGGTLYEEVEEAPVRGFEVLALTDSGLVMRLASTTFFDEEANKRVTQTPEGEYFLVWRKEGAAPAAVAAPAVEEQDEEVVERAASGSIFSGLFGSKQSASLATVAEKNLGGDSREAALQAQRAAAADAKQAEKDRKAAAIADRERRKQEAAERKKEASRRTQQDTLGDGTEVVTKPLFAFGNFGTAKKAEPKEESKTTGVSVKAGLGGLFGSQKTSKRDDSPAGDDSAVQRKQEAEAARERARQQKAGAKKQAQAEQRDQKRLKALAKKEEEARKREEQAEIRRRISDILADMQSDARDATLEVREQTQQLRTAERNGASAMRAGSAAEKQLESAEAAFSKAESELAEANDLFNEIAGQLREKQGEVNAVRNEVRQLENNLLKKV